jgi:hypothetical protein
MLLRGRMSEDRGREAGIGLDRNQLPVSGMVISVVGPDIRNIVGVGSSSSGANRTLQRLEDQTWPS